MKRLLLLLLVTATACAAKSPAVVSDKPFEPPAAQFYQSTDKFAHPPEIIAPRWLYPSDGLRAGALMPAEVVVLVQLDGSGAAKTLKVLSSPNAIFTTSAILALEKAKWKSPGQSWFYYRARFSLDDSKTEPAAPAQRP